jgi:hypothetical protein
MNSQQGWSNHYLHSYLECFKVVSGLSAFWTQRATEMRVDHKQPFVETDSEDDDNIPGNQPDTVSTSGMDVEGCLDTGSVTKIHAGVAKQRDVNHTVND